MNESVSYGIITLEKRVSKIDTKKIKLSFYLGVKRLLDIIFGLIGSLFVLPIALFVKIAYLKAKDKAPIFFWQERIGIDGKPIRILKFRTMVPNADKILFDLMEKDPAIREEYQVNKKLKDDPRVTKIGRLLRKLSLDEFPQFFQILSGSMSLIGPRPYLYREKKDMGLSFYKIITLKPGLTGYWQVNGRSKTDFKTRLDLDCYYIDNVSSKMDIKIFFKTITSVIKKEGAK